MNIRAMYVERMGCILETQVYIQIDLTTLTYACPYLPKSPIFIEGYGALYT